MLQSAGGITLFRPDQGQEAQATSAMNVMTQGLVASQTPDAETS